MATADPLRFTKIALTNGSGVMPALGFGSLSAGSKITSIGPRLLLAGCLTKFWKRLAGIDSPRIPRTPLPITFF
jgi:hypothetical protein